MYVVVQHYVSDVQTFWSAVQHAIPILPPYVTLHHCFPTPDGSHAVCLWEAESIRDVRAFLESYLGHAARSLYCPVENSCGFAMPSEVPVPDEVAGRVE